MQYISGWEALNIQSEKGHIADWHTNVYFKDFKPTQMYQFDKNSPLGMRGIKKRFIPYMQETCYVASFARAIADLVYLNQSSQLKFCAKDFLDDEEKKELFKYLKIINKFKNVEDFMKKELTKLYFEDKKCLNHTKSSIYPPKKDINKRDEIKPKSNLLKYFKKTNVNVCDIKTLVDLKVLAFCQRDEIRAFYDIGFLLDKYPQCFDSKTLANIASKILYSGIEELNLQLIDEVENHHLVDKKDIKMLCNYAEKILEKIDELTK